MNADKFELFDVFLEFYEILNEDPRFDDVCSPNREKAIHNWMIDDENFEEAKEFFDDHGFVLESNDIIKEFVKEDPSEWY